MRKILCLGDSNTFGFNPTNGKRYALNERWSGILKIELEKNKEFRVIEYGQNNRTCFSNPSKELNANLLLRDIIQEDITDIIFALGINDLQFQYNTTIIAFEEKLNQTIQKIKNLNSNLEILMLIPNVINDNILNSYFSSLFNEESIKLSKYLPEIFEKISGLNKCSILNLNEIVCVSEIDSLHYNKNNHQIIANHLINFYLNKPKILPNS